MNKDVTTKIVPPKKKGYLYVQVTIELRWNITCLILCFDNFEMLIKFKFKI